MTEIFEAVGGFVLMIVIVVVAGKMVFRKK
jgi:hypothetical protein